MESRLLSLIVSFALILVTALIGLVTFILVLIRIAIKGPKVFFAIKNRTVRPAALCSDEFGKHEFVRLKNSKLVYHYVVSGSNDKPLMLLLHGFPEFWYSWRYQLKEFSRDYRVVAIDMIGYGDSSKPHAVREYHVEKLANDISQLILALGYEKCILVGHDWGGRLSWTIAARYPSMIDKMVICNAPHPEAYVDHIKSSFRQAAMSWYILFFQVPILPYIFMRSGDFRWLEDLFCGPRMGSKPGTFTQDDLECYKYTFNDYDDLTGPFNYYRARIRYTAPDMKAKISCPVLIVWGTNDGALDTPLAEKARRYVRDYTVNYIDGASHWVQQEEPERVNEAIQKFLAADKSETFPEE